MTTTPPSEQRDEMGPPMATQRPWLASGSSHIVADELEGQPLACFTKTADRDLVVLVINSLARAPGAIAEWTCGHVCAAMCRQCWLDLAQKAHELAEANIELTAEVDELRRRVNSLQADKDDLATARVDRWRS